MPKFYDLAVARLKSSGVKLDDFPEKYVRARAANVQRQDQYLRRAARRIAGSISLTISITIPRGVAKHFTAENKPRLKAVRDALECAGEIRCRRNRSDIESTAAKLGVKVGAIVHPTRLAVTGSNVGPSLYHLLEVLGKKRSLARIDRALSDVLTHRSPRAPGDLLTTCKNTRATLVIHHPMGDPSSSSRLRMTTRSFLRLLRPGVP